MGLLLEIIPGGNNMKKAIIWDLDGTLLDSYDVIVESICLVFQECGIYISYNDVHCHAIATAVFSDQFR